MRRALIITAAGCSTRFSNSVGKEVLKVTYFEDSPQDCVIFWLLSFGVALNFDKIVVVGGFRFEDLRTFIDQYFGNKNIDLIYNEFYQQYGTCYSLYCGLDLLRNADFDEVVFVEGDLAFDLATFEKIVNSKKDVVTANSELITASKAVVFFVNNEKRLRYIYDTNHRTLKIESEFVLLGNSGQVWKFQDIQTLFKVVDGLGEGLIHDTNLLLIEKYFKERSADDIDYIVFPKWFNCNVLDDYRLIKTYKEATK